MDYVRIVSKLVAYYRKITAIEFYQSYKTIVFSTQLLHDFCTRDTKISCLW